MFTIILYTAGIRSDDELNFFFCLNNISSCTSFGHPVLKMDKWVLLAHGFQKNFEIKKVLLSLEYVPHPHTAEKFVSCKYG